MGTASSWLPPILNSSLTLPFRLQHEGPCCCSPWTSLPCCRHATSQRSRDQRGRDPVREGLRLARGDRSRGEGQKTGCLEGQRGVDQGGERGVQQGREDLV